MSTQSAWRSWADAHIDDYMHDLDRLVRIESPSTDKAACDRAGAYLADRFASLLGAEITWHRREEWGDHFRADIGGGSRTILILGHFDTVWPIGSLERLYRREGDELHAPGVFDMKGGDMLALWALRSVLDAGAAGDRRYVFLGTSDEETGSLSSQGLIEETAREADAVLVLEPAFGPDGACVVWRKGVGIFRLEVQGLAAHAGREPEKGRSAIVEMSRQVLDLADLNDPARGTSVNVGVVHGGTRSNVVAAHAEAEIDVRVREPELMDEVVSRILSRTPYLDGTSVRCEGGMNRPPMAQSEAALALYEKAKAAAAAEGVDLVAAGTGGASDGNYTAAIGRPTLDGMGVIGDGAHADHEHIKVSAVPAKLAWFARFLASI